jgi:hypothetical protein
MCCGEGEVFVSQLHKAYVGLAIAAANEEGSRTVSIRRFSVLEVRLGRVDKPIDARIAN